MPVCSVGTVVPDSATQWTVALQAPLSMGFSRQEYRSRFPCPRPGGSCPTGVEAASPAWQVDTLPLSPGEAQVSAYYTVYYTVYCAFRRMPIVNLWIFSVRLYCPSLLGWQKKLDSTPGNAGGTGSRSSLKQASELASNWLDTAQTVSALTACCEYKACSTRDETGDKSWGCWALGGTLAYSAAGLATL